VRTRAANKKLTSANAGTLWPEVPLRRQAVTILH